MDNTLKKVLIVVAVVSVLLAIYFGCFFKVKMETIEERLEDKYYDVVLIKDGIRNPSEKEKTAALAAMVVFYTYGLEDFEDANSVLYTEKSSTGLFAAVEFKTADDAEDFYKKIKLNWDETPATIDNMTYGKVGNIVYVGDTEAVKDAFEFPRTLFIREK